jgi:hypothetical protein
MSSRIWAAWRIARGPERPTCRNTASSLAPSACTAIVDAAQLAERVEDSAAICSASASALGRTRRCPLARRFIGAGAGVGDTPAPRLAGIWRGTKASTPCPVPIAVVMTVILIPEVGRFHQPPGGRPTASAVRGGGSAPCASPPSDRLACWGPAPAVNHADHHRGGAQDPEADHPCIGHDDLLAARV